MLISRPFLFLAPLLFLAGGLTGCASPVSELPAASGPVPLTGSVELRDPAAVFLTWTEDPTTTMTVDWHTTPEDPFERLEIRRVSGDWATAPPPVRLPFPFSERVVHRVQLTGLQPDTEYRIRFGEGSREYGFRTLPARLTRPVRFIAGGDLRHRQEWMEQTARAVMVYAPDFVLVGGDLAYADGREDRAYRWYEFFDAYRNTFVTGENRLVPMLAAPGNHEVRGSTWFNHEDYEPTPTFREQIAPYFFALFAFPGHPGYGMLDVGDYLSIFLLDTDHTGPIEGKQTAWVERKLRARACRPHLVPTYHVPAFPSVRSFHGAISQRVREQWVPLFERYGVRSAFEAHDHAYKRTHPIRDGRIAADGIVYFGDGAWGVGVREIGGMQEGEDAWYMKRGESARHAVVVTLDGTDQHFLAVDEDGNVIDTYSLTAPWSPPVAVEDGAAVAHSMPGC